MISVTSKGSIHASVSFHVGSCPISFEKCVEVTSAQVDGHELEHVYRVYPHLLAKFKGQTYKGTPARVIMFFGEDAQYAVNAFSEFR